MNTHSKKHSDICQKALQYQEEAEKNFKLLLTEISQAMGGKDTARLEMHSKTMTAIFEALRNNVISIQLSENKGLEYLNENELTLVLKGAENTLATIAYQNAALKGAVGVTEHIPDKV